ncbi:calcium:proton antiporter [Piscirickettsia litoralis]|uniref:Calcium:proton antiporter n=1 Tax=Piscirickettsia litoralis TaxID=1891921 RepID=A0ABX3A726_9GAMM|nr:calcium:proton antiporter [Piscirickettsia litoralis]ODN41909.1 calcium:proton antiporter [Piscirickettsia litoralis]
MKMIRFLSEEYKFLIGLLFVLIFFSPQLSNQLIPASVSFALSGFIVVFIVMIACAFSVVKHADWLAHRFGEPYGTIILTISVISIEVALISAVMLAGGKNPTLARDTMFAVMMISLNGLVGLSLLIGGIRHHSQRYNLNGANAFLSVLVPLSIICLISPNYTKAASYGVLSHGQATFIIIMSLVLYAVFLSIQTVRHKDFFEHPDPTDRQITAAQADGTLPRKVYFHIIMLLMALVVMVLLSKKLAMYIDFTISAIHAPKALSGLIVAILVLTPEGMSAIRAASRNRMQRCVNLCLGSALASLSLTIPAVLVISLLTHQTITLGLSDLDVLLLVTTLAVSMITFISSRTHILQGVVHIALFFTYIIFIFDLAK